MWRARLLLIACGGLLVATPALAADPSLTEYQVKSIFLFNFAKYVEWPSSAFISSDTPITIGILGENKFGQNLSKAVTDKNVNGRSIAIRKIENLNDVRACHILFVSNSEKKRFAEIFAQLKDMPILTVGETDDFTDRGGIIGFVKKEGKVRLEINALPARTANLQISSKLLSVADVVKGASQ